MCDSVVKKDESSVIPDFGLTVRLVIVCVCVSVVKKDESIVCECELGRLDLIANIKY